MHKLQKAVNEELPQGNNDRSATEKGTTTRADLGGFVGFERTPLFADIRLTGYLLLPAVFNTQRWRASPVWLLYNLRAIQFNVHAVK